MQARYVWTGRLVSNQQRMEGSIEVESDEPMVLDADTQRNLNAQVSQMAGQRIVLLTFTLCH